MERMDGTYLKILVESATQIIGLRETVRVWARAGERREVLVFLAVCKILGLGAILFLKLDLNSTPSC